MTVSVAWANAPVQGKAPSGPITVGRDDVQFARRLSDIGWYDMAQKVCEAVIADKGLEEQDRIDGQLLLLDLGAEKIVQEKDLSKRVELMVKNIADRREFLSKFKESPAASTVVAQLPVAYKQLADAGAAAMAKETDAEKVQALQQKCLDAFVNVIKETNVRVDELKNKLANLPTSAGEKEQQQAEGDYIYARFNQVRYKYFRAQLFKPEDARKKQVFSETIEAIRDFAFDYGDVVLCYEAYIIQAACEDGLGKTEDAIATLTGALGVRESFEKTADGKVDLRDPEWIDTLVTAAIEKMKLLARGGKHEDALATGKDVFDSLPKGVSDEAYYLLRAQMAEEMLETGDIDGANEVGKQLISLDRDGPLGARGREILQKASGGKSNALGAGEIVRLAQEQAARGEVDDAIETIRGALYPASGNGTKPSTEILLTLGSFYQKKGYDHEAVAAYDMAAELAQNTDLEPQILVTAVAIDIKLRGAEKKAYYEKRSDERLARIKEKYPKHPAASYAQLVDGLKLEGEKKYKEAADAYQKVQKDSMYYVESLYRAGNCLYREASRMAQDALDNADAEAAKGEKPANDAAREKKAKEDRARRDAAIAAVAPAAKPFIEQSEALLKKTIESIAPAKQGTLDPAALAKLDVFAIEARLNLARLMQLAIVHRDADSLVVLDDAEKLAGKNEDALSNIWRMRIQALKALDRIDDAEKLLEKLLATKPDAGATAIAAGIIARAIDTRAVELFKTDSKSKVARDLFTRAVKYYEASLKPVLANSVSMSTNDIQVVANRIFALARLLNDIPDDHESFLGIDLVKLPYKDFFARTAKLYAAALERAPSYRMEVLLGRAQGFQSDWAKAAETYAAIFQGEPMVGENRKLKSALIKIKPELLFAWVEYGWVERNDGVKRRDTDAIKHALNVFEATCRSLESNREEWWYSKYGQIQCLYDLGNYDQADIAIRDLKRGSEDYDGNKYGLRDKLKALEEDLKNKATK